MNGVGIRRREDHCLMGTCIKVLLERKGAQLAIKRGDVKWVLHRFPCDLTILQESKLEVVGHHIVVSLWGRHVQWLFLPSVGSGGIIIIWNP